MDMNGKMTFQAMSSGTRSAVSLGRVRTWEAGLGWEGFEKQEKHVISGTWLGFQEADKTRDCQWQAK